MKMTLRRLEYQINEGWGVGTLDHYQPWIKITKKVSSPSSNLSLVKVPNLNRLAHFLSRGERQLAYLLWWIGAVDVREQYPLWPWTHPHPLTQVWPERLEAKSHHPGLREIAKDTGIRLYPYPGMTVTAVLSLDLVATLPPSYGPHRLAGFSCKPKSLFFGSSAGERMRGRLELDRRYCISAEISHLLVHPEQIPNTLSVQLHWLAPLGDPLQIDALTRSAAYACFIEKLKLGVYRRPACHVATQAGQEVGWTSDKALRVLRIAIWRQDVDVDLLTPIELTRSLQPGGRALRSVLQRRLFGAPHET